MSFYTSSIKSHEVEPIVHNNQRTEFRLGNPDRPMYLSGMRLCNLGVVASVDNQAINRGAGLASLIKRLEILDGNVSLENFTNFNNWAGFRGQNRTNDVNISQSGNLNKSQIGFVNYQDVVNVLDAEPLLRNTEAATPKGWLSLRDYMAFLSDSNEIPTSVYKDLRIVIEYESDLSNVSPGTAATITSIVRPFMVVDEIVSEDLKKQRMAMYKGVTYRPLESAQVYSDVIAADRSSAHTLTGFNNKTIQKLLLAKAPTTTTSAAYGSLCSVNFLSPSYNLDVNGSQLLPQPIDTIAKELSSVSESWGDCNIPYPYNTPNVAGTTTDNANRVGWQSYVNFDVNQYSRELVLRVNRGHNANAYYTQGVNLIVFAEVMKAVIVNPDGSYNVRYL